MNTLARLYQYQPATLHALANLSDAKFWYSDPTRFNDPFDCALEIVLSRISDEEFAAIIERFPPDSSIAAVLAATPAEVAKEQLSEELKRLLRDQLSKVGGVCCFSEFVDSLPMWGHYADKHQGFCLEFDAAAPDFEKVKKVNYRDDFPEFTAQRIVESPVDALKELVLTKAECWRYEQEWRLFHSERGKAYGYDRRALTAVYFGARMPPAQQQMICAMLDNTDTIFYEMKLSKGGFSLERHEFTFTRINYRAK